MLAMLARQPTGAKIDEISVLGEVARLLGRSDLVIDLFSFAIFTLLDEFKSTLSRQPF